jgi:AcrR family transcriptional regulator
MEPADTLNRLRQAERETRRNLIMDAARTVFGEKSHDTVSMAEIARAAGIGKSSIYTYFPNQEALFVEIVCRDTGAFTSILRSAVAQTPENTLNTAITAFLEYYHHNESQWRMITRFALSGNISTPSYAKLNQAVRELMDVFDKVFKQMGLQKDIRLLSHALFSALSGILISFRKYPGRSDQERLAHMQKIAAKIETMFAANETP